MTRSAAQLQTGGRASRWSRQWPELVHEAHELVKELDEQGQAILERAAIVSRFDGYPSRASGAGTGAGGGSADPLGNAVVATLEGGDGDQLLDNAIGMRRHLLAALHELRKASKHRARAQALPSPSTAATAAPGQVECVACARCDVRETSIHKGGRCVSCYGYRRRHDNQDPPCGLIRARPETATRQVFPRREIE